MKQKSLIVLGILLLALVALGGSCNKSVNLPVIAIATLQPHPILDTVQENMLAELKRQGFEDGKNVRIVLRNANGQMQVLPTIANEIVGQDPQLIIAITTPVAQAVKKVAKCPVVFAAVTDPVGAGLVESREKGDPMVTGTSDAVPYDQQLKLIKRVSPSVSKLGVLFNPGEASSQFAISELRRLAPAFGITLVEGSVNSTNDMYTVAQDLSSKADALLISTDNTVAAGIAAAVKVASERKLPLFACDSGSVEKGAIAGVSAGYGQLGVDSGTLAARVFNGERGIPFLTAQGSEIYLNRKSATSMGVVIPSDVISEATKVLDEVKN